MFQKHTVRKLLQCMAVHKQCDNYHVLIKSWGSLIAHSNHVCQTNSHSTDGAFKGDIRWQKTTINLQKHQHSNKTVKTKNMHLAVIIPSMANPSKLEALTTSEAGSWWLSTSINTRKLELRVVNTIYISKAHSTWCIGTGRTVENVSLAIWCRDQQSLQQIRGNHK